MPRVDTDHGSLAYRVEGGGAPAILWIGGTGCPGALWQQQVDHFADSHRCITYDLPGCGESSVPSEGTCTPATLASDALRLLDHLGEDVVHCVGFSLGAAVAQELMLAAPSRIASSVLIGTWGSTARSRHMAQHYASRRMALLEAPREVFRAFGFWIWSASLRDGDPDRAAELDEFFGRHAASVSVAGYVAHYDADLAHETTARLPQIACPVLVLHGEEDVVTLPVYNREVAAAIPGAEIHEIPRGGHMVWCENPARVNAAIDDFLRAHTAG